MPREIVQPEPNKYGADTHPAFGMIGASRVSSTPGSILFDSDIRHGHSVMLRISRATRQREVNRDWIHGDSNDLIEVEMSEAQWASFVSSMNTTGVPCTIRRTEQETFVSGLPYEPRLQESMREVSQAADRAYAGIKQAMAEYEALPNTPAKAKKAALSKLHYAIENAVSNVDYAGKTLNEHAENVVQRARADIEAMVANKAAQLGLSASETPRMKLMSGESEDQ